MRTHSPALRYALVVIRGLTRLFPRRFRTAYGSAIVENFEMWWREIRGPAPRNSVSRARLFVRTALNIVVAAIAEHLRSSFAVARQPRLGAHVSRAERNRNMHGIWQDLRFALRSLRKQPFFTTVVVVTLAIGIGANTAIFSLVSRVLWNDLPYPHSGELVSVWSSNLARGVNRWGVSLHDYTDWRTRNDVLADVAAYNVNSINLSGLNRPERITFAQVTPSFFTTLQTPPLLGRFFHDEENLPGRDDVLILSYGFWQNMLGSDENALGKSLVVDGRRMTVIGVMPRGFAFPNPSVQLWKPFGMLPEDEGGRGGRWVRAIGRLAPGLTLERAQTSLDVLGAALAAEYPESNDGFGIYVEPLLATTVSGVQGSLLILWATTGFILLIVSANLANMMLARASARSQETAVRTALGASRGRLIRQLVAEGIPLALIGCALGVGMAQAAIRVLPALVDWQIPRMEEVMLDPRIVAYSLTLSVVVGIVFSIVPAFRSPTGTLSGTLGHGLRTSQSSGAVRTRNAIVMTQVAIAMIVVIGAGLLARSLVALLTTDLGFSSEQVLTVRIAPSQSELPERSQAIQLFEALQASVANMPGVQRVSAINALPLTGNSWGTSVEFVGGVPVDPSQRPQAFNRVVLNGYHETMGIPLVRGRLLTARDNLGAPNAIVISETAALSWWPDEDPIGKVVRYDGVPRTVVGVVGDVSLSGPQAPPASMLYVPFPQARFGHFQNWGMTFVIRTAGDPAEHTSAIVERMTLVAQNVPLYSVQTMADVMEANVATTRSYAQLLGIFAAVALSLSAVGVYSVISYLVNQNTREIGVRIALGAAALSVAQLVMWRALRLAGIGIVAGALAATMISRTLEGFLYQTSPIDPVTYAVAAGTFAFAVLIASVEPALRAARSDPAQALRGNG